MKEAPTKATGRTSDALVILDRMMGDDPALRRLAEEARGNAEVSQLVCDARTKAKLTQNELAALVGTTQSVIARLEDADYEGHSLTMLGRIATALGRRLEIRLVPYPCPKKIGR